MRTSKQHHYSSQDNSSNTPFLVRQAIKDFSGRLPFLFCWATGSDGFALGGDLNKVQMQKKVLLIIKAIDGSAEEPFPNGHENDIVFMEFTKPILENMYNVCTVSFIFILLSFESSLHFGDKSVALTFKRVLDIRIYDFPFKKAIICLINSKHIEKRAQIQI